MKKIYVKSYIGSSTSFSFYEKTEKELVAIESQQMEEGHWLESNLRALIGGTIFSVKHLANGNHEFYLGLNTGFYKIYSDELEVVQFSIDNIIGKKIIDARHEAIIDNNSSLDMCDYSAIARLLLQTDCGTFSIIFQGFSFGTKINSKIYVSQYVKSDNLWSYHINSIKNRRKL